MFFKSATLSLLLCIASVAYSAVSIGRPSIHPDHPGKCYYTATNKAYTPGEVFTAPNCTRVTCKKNLGFEYATCGLVAASPPCYVVKGDLTLPYPLCCDTIKCD